MEITLNPYQEKFIFSKKRFPCLAGGWGTGKTLSAIIRAELYSKAIPQNLGCIFRKTARSLNDSTLQDYQKYTGNKVDSNRNFKYANDSVIMFRHLDEIDSINQQNINLGWFYIEQGEELESDKEFWMLFGRLRRDLKPTPEFNYFGIPIRSGWVVCNVGDNWIKKNWRDHPFEESELIEACTYDNKHNLPADFLASLTILQANNPELYKQFVLNDWNTATQNKVFPSGLLDMMKERFGAIAKIESNRGVSIDPAGEGCDMNIFMAGNNGEVLSIFEKMNMSPMERAIKAIEMCNAIDGWFIVIDCDGLGIDTYTALTQDIDQKFLDGIQVIKFHGSASSTQTVCGRPIYSNKRSEAAFTTQRRGFKGFASIDKSHKQIIEDLEQDVSFTNNKGLQQLIKKEDIKIQLKRSPGHGDAYKMLQWAFEQKYDDQRGRRLRKRDAYDRDDHKPYNFNPATV
jgi:hypothetical protein